MPQNCEPYVGIPLTHRHRQERLQWVRGHRPWTRRQWNNVLFTDESRFNVSIADSRIRVWRRRGERLHANNVVQRDRYGGGSVMVWAEIYMMVRLNSLLCLATLMHKDTVMKCSNLLHCHLCSNITWNFPAR